MGKNWWERAESHPQSHPAGAGKDQAAYGVRVIDRRLFPGERAPGGNRFGDSAFEDTPGVKDTQCQVDTETGEDNDPATTFGCLLTHDIFLLCL